MRKSRQVSPERAVVWTERSPKYQQNRKVAVVYYLSRNRQLEHPHFIEVPVSSPEGLYLRDVIDKLNVLRGRGMASLYSWSCKRSYKSGYVWHDLSEDDLILPAHGSEYVLKGSELFEDTDSGHLVTVKNTRSPIHKQLPDPESSSSRRQEESPSSIIMSGRDTIHSPESRDEKNSSSDESLSLADYKVYKIDNLADASTQTETTTNKEIEIISAENDAEIKKDSSDLYKDSDISRISSSPSPPSAGKSESLEALIRADVMKLNNLRIAEERESFHSSTMKLKPANLLMQLISCGSISVKDHSFGLIPNYRPSFAESKFPSPLFSTSTMLGELENPRFASMRLENKEYFSGSIVETNMLKGAGVVPLKRSSSFNADRNGKQIDLDEIRVESTSSTSKCIPLPIKASLSKHPKAESMKSPVSEGPRLSVTSSPSTSNGGSKRISEYSSEKKQSKRLDSFREESENVIKIEESLLQAPGS